MRKMGSSMELAMEFPSVEMFVSQLKSEQGVSITLLLDQLEWLEKLVRDSPHSKILSQQQSTEQLQLQVNTLLQQLKQLQRQQKGGVEDIEKMNKSKYEDQKNEDQKNEDQIKDEVLEKEKLLRLRKTKLKLRSKRF